MSDLGPPQIPPTLDDAYGMVLDDLRRLRAEYDRVIAFLEWTRSSVPTPEGHCKRGHELTPDNVYILQTGSRAGRRRCKICALERQNAFYHRRRANVTGRESGMEGRSARTLRNEKEESV
jgi:hypothetical protein